MEKLLLIQISRFAYEEAQAIIEHYTLNKQSDYSSFLMPENIAITDTSYTVSKEIVEADYDYGMF